MHRNIIGLVKWWVLVPNSSTIKTNTHKHISYLLCLEFFLTTPVPSCIEDAVWVAGQILNANKRKKNRTFIVVLVEYLCHSFRSPAVTVSYCQLVSNLKLFICVLSFSINNQFLKIVDGCFDVLRAYWTSESGILW